MTDCCHFPSAPHSWEGRVQTGPSRLGLFPKQPSCCSVDCSFQCPPYSSGPPPLTDSGARHQAPRRVIKYFIGIKKKSPSSQEGVEAPATSGPRCQVLWSGLCTRRPGPQGVEAGVCLPVSEPRRPAGGRGEVWARSGAWMALRSSEEDAPVALGATLPDWGAGAR